MAGVTAGAAGFCCEFWFASAVSISASSLSTPCLTVSPELL